MARFLERSPIAVDTTVTPSFGAEMIDPPPISVTIFEPQALSSHDSDFSGDLPLSKIQRPEEHTPGTGFLHPKGAKKGGRLRIIHASPVDAKRFQEEYDLRPSVEQPDSIPQDEERP